MGWLGISCDVEGKGWESLVSFSGKGMEFGGRMSIAFFFLWKESSDAMRARLDICSFCTV